MQVSISIETTKVQYVGTGAQTVFAYPFRILQDSDLLVIVSNDSTGAETTLTLNSDYTVSGAGDDGGGNVTLDSASLCESGQTLTILRNIPATQTTDYVDGEAFSAESFENALDKLTMIQQQQREEINRAPKLPKSSSITDIVLPNPTANNYIGWNAGATGLANMSGPVITTATAYEIDALVSYGGGTNYTDATINAALTAIGTTNKVTLLLRPGTWVIGSNVDWSAYTNVTFKIPSGTQISHGSYTLKMPYPDVGLYYWNVGTGATTYYGNVGRVWVAWYGADPTGVILSNAAFTAAKRSSSTLYLGTGIFRLENWGTVETGSLYPADATRIVGESSHWGTETTIQGSGDLIVNASNLQMEYLAIRNTTAGTRGKLITGYSGSVGKFTEVKFGRASYHIYMPYFSVGTSFFRCMFGGNGSAEMVTGYPEGASVYSRYFPLGFNDYFEIDCYTRFNKRGIYLSKSSGNANFSGVYEYNDEGAFYLDALTGTALNGLKVNAWFEVNGNATPSPDITITAETGSGLRLTLDNCTWSGPTVSPTVNVTAASGGTVFIWVYGSTPSISTGANLINTWTNENDTNTGQFSNSTVTPVNVTLAGGGTAVTYTGYYAISGAICNIFITMVVDAGTMATVDGSSYLSINGTYLPRTTARGPVAVYNDSTGTHYSTGSVGGTGTSVIQVRLPTITATAGPLYIMGSYIVK